MPILYLHAFAPSREPPCINAPWLLLNVFLAKGTNVQVSASRKKGVIFYPLDFCSGSIYFELESVADLIQDDLPHV